MAGASIKHWRREKAGNLFVKSRDLVGPKRTRRWKKKVLDEFNVKITTRVAGSRLLAERKYPILSIETAEFTAKDIAGINTL